MLRRLYELCHVPEIHSNLPFDSVSSSTGSSPIPPLPLLITGIAGVAGYNAFQFFRSLYGDQVIGLRRADNWRLQGPGIEPCNADDAEGLKRIFDKHAFAAVLNSEGSCHLKGCELDPEMAHRINVQSVRNLLDTIRGSDTRLVHLSIDLVYGGGSGVGGHLETDPPDPVTVYGKTMVLAESLIQAEYPAAAILRISLPMGISFNGHAGAIDWIQSRFKKKKPATLYYDEIRTPTYCDCLNGVFSDVLARRDIQGLFHAGGTQPLSLYQIAQIVNRIGGYDPQHLHGCMRIEAGPIPPRAGNVTMDSSKLALALGYQPFAPWPHDKAMVPIDKNWHWERSVDEVGSYERVIAELYRNPATISRMSENT
jgi:dTDP-4-dehydrorhamnose reductase